MSRDLVTLACGAALILGFARSASLRQSTGARTVVVETLLGLAGLGVARALAGPGPVAIGLALWGYFLVQSCWFLVSGWGPRRADRGAEDPFDRARRRILELLGEPRASL